MSLDAQVIDRPTGNDALIGYRPDVFDLQGTVALDLRSRTQAAMLATLPTGQDTIGHSPAGWAYDWCDALRSLMLVYRAPYLYSRGLPLTGSAQQFANMVWINQGRDDPFDLGITSHTMPVRFAGWPPLRREGEAPAPRITGSLTSPSTPAKQIWRLSGLSQSQLASVFDVSRTTFVNWIGGVTPKGARHASLLQVLRLLEEADERFPDRPARVNWLLAPVRPGGPSPLELLRSGRYAAFRGFLLRLPTQREAIRPLRKPSGIQRHLSREELAERLEHLNPKAIAEE
jgi:hypothetical protein